MPLPAAPAAAAFVGFLLWLTSSSGGAGMGAGQLAQRQWLAANPGKTQADFIAWVKARGEAAQGAADEASAGGNLPEVSEALQAYAELVPWSGEWLKFWSDAMGLPPIPSSLRKLYNQGIAGTAPHAFLADGPGGYIYALAAGLRIVPGAAKAGETGEPKEWAKQWLVKCALNGPSKEVDHTLFTWGPMYGLTVDGALRAEHLGYRPSKWPWTVKPGNPTALQAVIAGVPAPEYIAGHSGFEVSKGMVDLLSLIPIVGSIIAAIVKAALGTAEKAAHYDRAISPLTAAADPSGLLTIFGVAQLEQAGGPIDGDQAAAASNADIGTAKSLLEFEEQGRNTLLSVEKGS